MDCVVSQDLSYYTHHRIRAKRIGEMTIASQAVLIRKRRFVTALR